MSELLLKFNQLDALQKQELLDFLDFLLTKSKKEKLDLTEYKKQIQEISVWSEEDIAETYNFFESAGLMENRDIDANQLRRDAWKIKP